MAKQPFGLVPVDFDPFADVETSGEGVGMGLMKVDYDPFAEAPATSGDIPEGRFLSGLNAATQGTLDIPAGVAKSVGISSFQTNQGLNAAFDAIDNGEDLSTFPASFEFSKKNDLPPQSTQHMQVYSRMGPEQRQEYRARFERQDSPKDTGAYQAGDGLSNWARDNFPENPEYQGEFLASKLPRGLGSTLGFLGTTAATIPLGGVPALATTAFVGAGAEKSAMFEDALQNGADLGQALEASDYGAWIGTTEAVPIAPFLSRLDKVTGGGAKRLVVDALKQGTEEAIQEASQSILENLVANDIVGYDKERGTFTGTGENAGVGFTAGVIYETIGGLVMGRHSRSASMSKPAPTGKREQAAQQAPELSEADRASPIPDDLIQQGKSVVQDGEATRSANDILRSAGVPQVNTKVSVQIGDKMATGTIVDAYEDEQAGSGVKLHLDDGSNFSATFEDISSQNIQITPVSTPQAPTGTKKGDVSTQMGEGGQQSQFIASADIGTIKTATGADIATITIGEGDEVRVLTTEDGRQIAVMGADSEAQALSVARSNRALGMDEQAQAMTMPILAFKDMVETKPDLTATDPLDDPLPADMQPTNVSRETNQEQSQKSAAFDPATHYGAGIRYAKTPGLKLTPLHFGKEMGLRGKEARDVLDVLAARGVIRKTDKGYSRIPVRKGPVDMLTFIADHGGLRDDEGHDLKKGRNAQRLIPGVGALIRSNGMGIDAAGERLHEAGYFGPLETTPRPTEAQVLEVLDRALAGEKVYRAEEAHVMEERAAQLRAEDEYLNQFESKGEAESIEAQIADLQSQMDSDDSYFDVLLAKQLKNLNPEDIYATLEGEPLTLEDRGRIDDEIAQAQALNSGQPSREPEGIAVRPEGGQGTGQINADERGQDGGTETAGQDRPGVSPGKDASNQVKKINTAPADNAGVSDSGEQRPTTETVTNVAGATEQGVIPGAEKISDKELAERKMAGPMKAKASQKDAGSDGGLFDTGARDQVDMFDAPKAKPVDAQKQPDVTDKPQDKIEDFGEKIHGARKDTFTGFKEALSDEGIDVNTAPLSKSFPQPNYVKLAEEGVSGEVMAYIAVIRNTIPSKPRSKWKVARWAKQVELLRGFANDILSGNVDTKTLDHMMKVANATTLGDIPTTVKAIKDIAPADMEKAARYSVRSASYSMFKGERYNPSKSFWFLTDSKNRTVRNSMGNDPAMQDTHRESEEEAISLAKKLIPYLIAGKEETGTKTRSKYTAVNVYRDHKTSDIFLGFKVRSTVLRLKAGFETPTAAREYLDENRDDVQAKIDDMRKGPNMRGTENRARSGQDLRDGDVSPETFSEAFGFRGVQFGNYVEGPRRQSDLNRAYDALMDLADTIGVPPKAISLNGELGLAFGARGTGGNAAAAAHYEPGQVVINLTKGSGPGSLAHEWLHGLDNYFARQDDHGKSKATGQDQDYMSSRRRTEGTARDEVYQAWKGVQTALAKGGFAERSVELDKAKSKPYWNKTIEKAARAFEKYMVDRLSEKGAINDYLANIDQTSGAYPTNDEMKQDGIREAFDNLFNTIEHRETDKGVEMFSVFNDPDWTGVAQGLDWKVQTKIVEIKKQYEDVEDASDVRRLANQEISAPDGILGEYQNLDTGWDIHLYAKGIKKTLSGEGSKIRAALAWKLPDLLKHAILVETVSDNKTRADINRIHRFYAAAQMDGDVRRIKITVREHSDGMKRQYDIDHLDIEKPGTGLSPSNDRTTSGVGSIPLPGSSISIRQLLDDVNSEVDGQPVLGRGESHAILAEYDWKTSVDREELAQKIITISKRIAPKVKVQVVDELLGNVPGRGKIPVTGVHRAAQNLIEVAIDLGNPEKTIRHEGIHALYSMGLIHKTEQNILANKARREWIEKYNIDKLYPNASKEQKIEEAVAQASAEYGYGDGKFPPGIRRILEKIKQFLERLGNALNGMGYQSASDIFDKIESGEVGKRDRMSDTADGISYSVSDDGKANTPTEGTTSSPDRGGDQGSSARQARSPEEGTGTDRGKQSKAEQVSGSGNGAVPDSGDKFSIHDPIDDLAASESFADRAVEALDTEAKKRGALRKATQELKHFATDPAVPHAKDLNWFANAIVHPRTIASIYSKFTPVWLAVEKQFKRRDTINADLTRILEPYHKLDLEDKAQVHKVLEIGRLEGGAIDSPMVGVTNKLGDAALSKRGERVELNKAQSEAYHAVRSAMDKALDLYKQQVLREWGFGKEGDPETAKDLEAHAKELYQEAKKSEAPEEARDMNREADSARQVAQLVAEIEQAKKGGYVPFTRFGEVSISVRDKGNNLVHFEKIEVGGAVGRLIHRKKVIDVRRKLMSQYPKSQGYDVEAPRQMVNANDLAAAGIKIGDVDALAELGRVEGPEWEAVREQLNEASKKVGFRKHFIGAKNTPGYSPDFERSIADYVTGISSYLARREVRDELDTAVASIPQNQTNLRKYADVYIEYVQSPKETLQWLRSLNFFFYLSGNPSSASVNLTQVPLATMPYLSQFASAGRINIEMTRAYKDLAKMAWRKPTMDGGTMEFFDPSKAPEDVREDLQRAWDDGTLVPLVTMEQMGVAHGSEKFRRGFSKGTQATVEFAGSMFTGAERANRIVTFIAAHRLARRPGVMEKVNEVLTDNALWASMGTKPVDFAEWVIDETHFVLGKRNRPTWFRDAGAWPGTAVFQFRGFSVNYLELMWRMARQNGPEGKKALAYVFGALMASAGLWGLPFGDDLKDLFEAIYAWATDKEIDLESELREIVYEMSDSALLAETVNRGALRMTGADMSHRLDMGNILPTDTILALFGKDTNRAAEALGVSYDMLVGRPQRAIEHLKNDEPTQAVAQMLPSFASNPVKAYGWAADGVKSRDRVAIPKEEITNLDVALKALGFTPVSITRRREKQWAKTRAQRSITGLQGRYYTRLARAVASGNRNEVEVIRSELMAYNADRPIHERVIINPGYLKRLVRQEVLGYGARRISKKARGRAAELDVIYPD